ncbi:DUF1214 domain-containing protein [Listeria welshimeri]|nr:DUF1214 domain-containing protein [Listeria welshimeri]MBC1606881.1 DUF1214 domain-containing protein [Listeria welshimeri]MBC1618150.1 DUF1214 domain-containing protein [Listeria welshimeri]MBC1621447.1 DUF1214 domain-containing protein [Listeria welshimeri]MBC1626841.1 DUF1214 domain-containing protein [Listeria welshimeri]
MTTMAGENKKYLNGVKNYRIHFDNKTIPPVNEFWYLVCMELTIISLTTQLINMQLETVLQILKRTKMVLLTFIFNMNLLVRREKITG